MLLAVPLPRVTQKRSRRRLIGIAVSAVLHAALLLALLYVHPRTREPNWLPPPVDVIFEKGGSKEAPSVPNPAPPEPEKPASPPQEQTGTPSPPVPPQASAPPPQPEPQPEPAQPEQQAVAQPQTPEPPAAVQQPEPTPPKVSEPAQAQPAPAPPPAPSEPMQTAIQLVPLNLPPPLLLQPPPVRPPTPRPKAAAPPAPPPRPRPAFPTPMAYSFGPSAPRSSSPSPARNRGIDLAFAPAGSFADRLQQGAHSDDPNVGEDWLNLVSAWWNRHGYYPPQAGLNGEQGVVTVGLTVRHDGKVVAIRLEGRSGSQWLDLGALSVFRDAQLPPLPPDVSEREIPLHFTIHYIIEH